MRTHMATEAGEVCWQGLFSPMSAAPREHQGSRGVTGAGKEQTGPANQGARPDAL